MTKRKIESIIGISLVSVVAVVELVILGISFVKQQNEQISVVSSDLVVQLSLLDSSMRSGDQAQFEKAQNGFADKLATFSHNIIAIQKHGELISQLKEYKKRVETSHYAEESRQLAQTRGQFLNEISNISLDVYNFDSLGDLKQSFANFKSGLEQLNLGELTDARAKIIEGVDLAQNALKDISDCIGVCTEVEFAERQNAFSAKILEIITALDSQNQTFAEQFNAAELARQLGEIAKSS